jgi:NADH:ubiquinone oxidoreductase subunit D
MLKFIINLVKQVKNFTLNFGGPQLPATHGVLML